MKTRWRERLINIILHDDECSYCLGAGMTLDSRGEPWSCHKCYGTGKKEDDGTVRD